MLTFPHCILFLKLTNASASLDDDLTTVNNFFVHRIKEIDITKYGTNHSSFQQQSHRKSTDIRNRCLNICRKKALKMIENDFLYSKEKANYPNNEDRRVHYSTALADITETSMIELISFRNSLKLNIYTESR